MSPGRPSAPSDSSKEVDSDVTEARSSKRYGSAEISSPPSWSPPGRYRVAVAPESRSVSTRVTGGGSAVSVSETVRVSPAATVRTRARSGR